MKRMMRLAVAALLLGSLAPTADAMQVLQTDKLGLDMYGRAQMIGVGQYVPVMSMSRTGRDGSLSPEKYVSAIRRAL